ncbi:MAG TPA: hypothetical protein VKM55_23525 [Candidatus Lokiarchaeia archaeon]|nr:hypothetical protein [Candidatus Lokiarchaeia archaeon]
MYIPAIFFNVLFFVVMLVFGIILVRVAWWNKGTNIYGFYSAVVSAIEIIAIGITIPFFELFPYPYIGFMSWWIYTWFAITTAFYIKRHRKLGKPRMLNGKPVDAVPVQDGVDGLKYKHEKARKTFHLAGFLLAISYFLVAPMLSIIANQAIAMASASYVYIWGPMSEIQPFSSLNEAAIILTLFALCGTIILTLTIDSFRMLAGDEYSILSLVERRAGKILRDKEKGCPGPQDFLAIAASCSWLIGIAFHPILPGSIFIAVAANLISTLADGAAAIIGKSFGRHKIQRPHNQVKSIEGLIAGFIVAFACAIPFMNWIVALVLATLFLLIDFWSPPVADNAINAVIITVAGCVLALIL